MENLVHSIVTNPAFAALGFGVFMVILLAPLALRLAGLSGSQIVQVLTETIHHAAQIIKALRCTDDSDKSA